jgi:hypothetical protein
LGAHRNEGVSDLPDGRDELLGVSTRRDRKKNGTKGNIEGDITSALLAQLTLDGGGA